MDTNQAAAGHRAPSDGPRRRGFRASPTGYGCGPRFPRSASSPLWSAVRKLAGQGLPGDQPIRRCRRLGSQPRSALPQRPIRSLSFRWLTRSSGRRSPCRRPRRRGLKPFAAHAIGMHDGGSTSPARGSTEAPVTTIAACAMCTITADDDSNSGGQATLLFRSRPGRRSAFGPLPGVTVGEPVTLSAHVSSGRRCPFEPGHAVGVHGGGSRTNSTRLRRARGNRRPDHASADPGGCSLKNTSGAGAVTVFTEPEEFIQLLRNQMRSRSGDDILICGGRLPSRSKPRPQRLRGRTKRPGDVVDSDMGFGQISTTPNARASIHLLHPPIAPRSSLDVEMLVREDLANINAVGIDLAAVNGSGSKINAWILNVAHRLGFRERNQRRNPVRNLREARARWPRPTCNFIRQATSPRPEFAVIASSRP